ncbi:unnamed protein product [Chrysoparadoxa australica]
MELALRVRSRIRLRPAAWSNGTGLRGKSSFSGNVSPGALQAEVMAKCEDLHTNFIQPLNDRIHGPLEKSTTTGGYRSTKLPFVFLLGNHSSGKSTFINYVLGRKVQTAGVAPTDDSFTIIAPGPGDIDQDGPALVGDPDLGFAGMRQFGPTLMHHTCLKVRARTNTDSFMMVDSPGMIDSPVNMQASSPLGMLNQMDRGYDFQGVVKWFAERADVILLFFDPDKPGKQLAGSLIGTLSCGLSHSPITHTPGTTGETLSVLVNSLPGMEHKLYIVLNKADQFKRIHDFARAYGSLCWNLSKVIPRKDLPRIYTMCLPVSQGGIGKEASDPRSRSMSEALKDLESTRDDVTEQVMKAPQRRIDNAITRLTDSVHLLQVHAKVLEEIQREFKRSKWSQRGTTAATLTCGMLLSGGSLYMAAPVEVTLGAAALGLVAAAGMHWMGLKDLTSKEALLLSNDGLDSAFNRCYARDLSEGDEHLVALWRRIKPGIKISTGTYGLENISAVKHHELRKLVSMLQEDIPDLRRKAAPEHFSFKNRRNGAGRESTDGGATFRTRY